MRPLYHVPCKTIMLIHFGRSHPGHTSGGGICFRQTVAGLVFIVPAAFSLPEATVGEVRSDLTTW